MPPVKNGEEMRAMREREYARQRRAAARRRRRERDARESERIRRERLRRSHMRRVTREAYQGAHPPLPGSALDVRLRVLALSLRSLAARADLHPKTVHRIERGDPTVTGPTLRKYAAAVERLTRRRTRVSDVRRMMGDGR